MEIRDKKRKKNETEKVREIGKESTNHQKEYENEEDGWGPKDPWMTTASNNGSAMIRPTGLSTTRMTELITTKT